MTHITSDKTRFCRKGCHVVKRRCLRIVFPVIRGGKVLWRGRFQKDLIAMWANPGVKNGVVFSAAGMMILGFRSHFLLSFYHLKHTSRAFAGLFMATLLYYRIS